MVTVVQETSELGPEAPTPRRSTGRVRRFLWQLVVLALVVGVWQLLCATGVINELFVASPSQIASEFVRIFSGSLLPSVGTTLEETVLGCVIGLVLGVLAGVFCGFVPAVRDVMEPYVSLLNSCPRIALAPLFIFWFGIGAMSKVVLVVTYVFFIVYINVIEGIKEIDDDLITIAKLYGATRAQITRTIVLPSLVPWLLASLRMSIAAGIVAATIGEMFGSKGGVGQLIVAGSGTFDIPEVFAAILLVMIVAWLIDIALRQLGNRLLRWRNAVPLA